MYAYEKEPFPDVFALSLSLQVQFPLHLLGQSAAPAALAMRVHAGGGRGGHGEVFGAADGGGDDGGPGGEAQDRDGPHDRAPPQEGAHPGKKETKSSLDPF